MRRVEPRRPEAIIAELWAEAPSSRGVGQGYVRQVLTAVDGSVVKTLASLAEAAYLRDKNGRTHCGWRFHTHFDIDRQLPVRIEVTSALKGGKTDEKHVLRRSLQPNRCHVMDRFSSPFSSSDILGHGGPRCDAPSQPPRPEPTKAITAFFRRDYSTCEGDRRFSCHLRGSRNGFSVAPGHDTSLELIILPSEARAAQWAARLDQAPGRM